jgi:hypothetical protein
MVIPSESSYLILRGIQFRGEICKNHVKMTFPRGASLKDPSGLLDASLDGTAWRHRYP